MKITIHLEDEDERGNLHEAELEMILDEHFSYTAQFHLDEALRSLQVGDVASPFSPLPPPENESYSSLELKGRYRLKKIVAFTYDDDGQEVYLPNQSQSRAEAH